MLVCLVFLGCISIYGSLFGIWGDFGVFFWETLECGILGRFYEVFFLWDSY